MAKELRHYNRTKVDQGYQTPSGCVWVAPGKYVTGDFFAGKPHLTSEEHETDDGTKPKANIGNGEVAAVAARLAADAGFEADVKAARVELERKAEAAPASPAPKPAAAPAAAPKKP